LVKKEMQMPAEIIIEGRDGRRRRARKGEMLKDGERFLMPMAFMDAQAREVRDALAEKYGGGFSPTFADGTPDHTSPHRPGYRFADTGDAARLVAEQAYRERCQDLHYTSRRDQQDGIRDERHATPTLDELRQAADAAYREKCERSRNAWRNR